MKPKIRGWNEGIMSENLTSVGGYTHKKGSVVRYKRKRVYPDDDGSKLWNYEWHYLDENNYNLVRSDSRTIEGLPIIIEKMLY